MADSQVWCGSGMRRYLHHHVSRVQDRLLIEKPMLLYIIIGALGIVGMHTLGLWEGTTDDVLHGPMRTFLLF